MTVGVPAAGIRVGQGFDLHPFLGADEDPGDRVLTLGGVTFAGETPLRGHSDADAAAHACADALLGAAGLGDIGQHFPDTDPAWAGADSLRLLAEVADRVRAAHAGGGEATDDASLVEAAGGTVVVVPGRSHNLKITDPGDLRIAAVLLDEADA